MQASGEMQTPLLARPNFIADAGAAPPGGDALGKAAVRIDGSRTCATLTHRTPMQAPTRAWANGEQLAKPLANGDVAV